MSRLSAAEQVRRNGQLIADHARGLRISTLAEKYELSPHQVRNILKARPPLDLPLDIDPRRPYFELLDSLEIAIEDYARQAETAQDDHARRLATNKRVETQLKRFELMCEWGLIPALPDAGTREAIRVAFELLEEVELSDEQRARLATARTAGQPAQSRWDPASADSDHAA